MIRLLFNIFKKDQRSIKYIKMSKQKKVLFGLFIGAIILFAMFSLIAPLLFDAENIQKTLLIDIGILGLIIALYLSFVVAFVYSIGFLFSSLYLDKNLENYLSLPISRRDFIIAKILMVYYNVLMANLIVTAPFILFYLYVSDISIMVLLALLFYIITMPIFTVIIAALVIGTIMFFINKLKNKKLARTILYSFSTILIVIAYFYFTLKLNSVPENDYMAMYNMLMSTMDTISIIFTYPNIAYQIIVNSDIISTLKMLGIIIILLTSILYIERIYFKSAIGFNENSGGTKKKFKKNTQTKQYSITTWFFMKEAKEIFKTGIYFFNTVFTNFFVVAIYLVMLGYNFIFVKQDISMIYKYIDMVDVEFVIIIVIIVATFFNLFNIGGATVFSREAKSIDFINSLPIKKNKAIYGKLLFHELIEFITLIVFILPIMIYLNFSIVYLLIAVAMIILVVFSTSYISVIIDLNFPNLDWESQTAVIKSSRSIIISMIVSLLFSALIVGVIIVLYFKLNIDHKIIAYGLILFYAILSFILYKYYNKSVDKAFIGVKK